MKARITIEAREFLRQRGMPAARLAHEAGIAPVILTRVLSGERKDMVSTNADALRDAMERLAAAPSTPTPLPQPEESTDAA